MNPEQLAKSFDALLNACPDISMPPVPCGESADSVTYLGIAFTFDGAPPAAKIYFSPKGGSPSLPPEMPDALRKSMDSAILAHRRESWRLHDASVERARNGEVIGRLLWALRSADRVDDRQWSRLVLELLSSLGHPGLAEPLLRLNTRLRDILQSEMAPLCQLGGFLAADGSLFRLKANFDADTSLANVQVSYNPLRAREATRFLLGACGVDAQGVERLASHLDVLANGACHVHSWGLHAKIDRIESLKVYIKDQREPSCAIPFVLREAGLGWKGISPDSILCQFGWRYHGFYAEVAASSFRTIKFYFSSAIQNATGGDITPKK